MTIVSTLADVFRHDSGGQYTHQYAIEVEADGEAVLPNGVDGLPRGTALDFDTARVIVTISGTHAAEPKHVSVSPSGPSTGGVRWVGTQQFKRTSSKDSLGAMPDWLRTVVSDHVPDRFLTRLTEAS